MTAPKHTVYSPHGRLYQLPGAKHAVPGVTTVLGQKSKPFLQPWAAKMAGECAVHEREKVLAILGDNPSAADEAAAIDYIKNASKRQTTAAAETGTAVHGCVEEAMLNGGCLEAEYPKQVAGHMAQFALFQQAHPELEYLGSELTVFGTTGGGYAGSLDAIVRIDLGNGPQVTLLDTKTSKGVYPETALQLSAYSRAEHLVLRTGEVIPMPQVEAAAILHLRPRSHHLVPVDLGEQEWVTFRALLAVWRWTATRADDVLLPQVRPAADLTSAGAEGPSNDDLLARLMDGASAA